MAKFDREQIDQLKKLLDERFEAQDIRLVKELDRRFGEQDQQIDAKFSEQDAKIDAKFAEQQNWLEAQFREERAYFQQLIKEELADIRFQLDQLNTRTHEDETKALV